MTMNSMAPPLGSVAGAADLQMQLELLGHRQPGRAPLLHARFDARPGAFGEVGDVVRLAGVDVQVEVAVDADALEVQRADARGAPSTVDDGDRAGPAGGGAADLHRETGDREAVAGQRLEVVQLLEVAVADLAPGLVPLPDQRGVAGLLEFRLRMNERRVPRPGVGARHAHAALEQVQRRLAAHARARRHVVRLAVGRARARVHDDDVERTQRVADALQLRLHVLRRHDVAVGPRAEVELHAGLKAPLERHLVDRDRALAAVHRRGEVIRRVEVRAVVGHEADPLDRPALGVGQLRFLQPREEGRDVLRGVAVAEVLDLRAVARRIGDHVVLDGHRQIDDRSGHAGSLCDSWAVVRLYLVRHGKAAASFSEAPNPGLDATGAAQAEAMAERLAPLGPLPIVTSPLKRTRETAAPLVKRLRFTARIEPTVGEIPSPMEDPAARGEWLRAVMASAWSAQPDELRTWRQRVLDALVALARPTVVISHFIAINVAIGFAEGDDRVVRFALQNRRPTVWVEGGYPERLGLHPSAQGTGMSTADAHALRINDLSLFVQYMKKAWESSEAYVQALAPGELDRKVALKFVGEMPVARVIASVAITHGFTHFGEIELARTLVGAEPVSG